MPPGGAANAAADGSGSWHSAGMSVVSDTISTPNLPTKIRPGKIRWLNLCREIPCGHGEFHP